MRIVSFYSQPLATVAFLNAPKRGSEPVKESLPILRAVVEGLPVGLDALLVTGDLQGAGMENDDARRLLGVTLADRCATLSQEGKLPAVDCTGVILAGDLYSSLEAKKRGESGDVREVWRAFRDKGFRWVAGVAGNHDRFGTVQEQAAFAGEEGISLLDCAVQDLDRLPIGGIGGAIGPRGKEGCVERNDYLEYLHLLLDEDPPQLLVLHDSPQGDADQPGKPEISELLAGLNMPLLVVSGHIGWERPLHELGNGVQILNVEKRAVVLTSCCDCSKEQAFKYSRLTEINLDRFAAEKYQHRAFGRV